MCKTQLKTYFLWIWWLFFNKLHQHFTILQANWWHLATKRFASSYPLLPAEAWWSMSDGCPYSVTALGFPHWLQVFPLLLCLHSTHFFLPWCNPCQGTKARSCLLNSSSALPGPVWRESAPTLSLVHVTERTRTCSSWQAFAANIAFSLEYLFPIFSYAQTLAIH